MTSWTSALDDFEDRLARAEDILELGADVDPTAPFRAPDLVGSLPPELLERAGALLARAGAVEQRLLHEQSRIRSELAQLPKPPAAERRTGTHVAFQA